MHITTAPGPENDFHAEHAELLIRSYQQLTGKELVSPQQSPIDTYRALFTAPYGVVSHNTDADPVFNYGNQTALEVFAMDWSAFTRLPSRHSAEPVNREERRHLLDEVSRHGFIDNYSGIRISASGQRFMIADATVWNLLDTDGVYRGQAAVFHQWTLL